MSRNSPQVKPHASQTCHQSPDPIIHAQPLAEVADYGEEQRSISVLMHSEDNGAPLTESGVPFDLERGTVADSKRPLYSWSSYLAPSRVRFNTPNYTHTPTSSPSIRSENIGNTHENSTHGKLNSSQSPSCPSPLRCHPLPSSILLGNGSITPGILRPEEHNNDFGRCHHYDNRFHPVLDSQLDLCRNDSIDTNATLVNLSISQQSSKEFHPDASRRSSSSSTYSSQFDENDNTISTRQLIRYYTNCVDEPDEEILTTRSGVLNKSVSKEFHVTLPLQNPQSSRLPPPYQQPLQTVPSPVQENFKPRSHSPFGQMKNGRRQLHSYDIIEKNVYVLKLCKSFLLFGVESHRLGEYLHNTAAFLEITAEFQHVPHCMLIVLTNPNCVTNEVHLLKESTVVDLGKLEDVYQVYTAVLESDQDLKLSIRHLDMIARRRKIYTNLLLTLLHGVAALCAGTFAFSARPTDFGPLFVFGCLLAILQLLVIHTPIRNSHILEVLTSVIIAFTARGLGSIYFENGKPMFCFSGITQGTIALILPGHIILAAIQEIQHRQVLSGSIKMVYAVLYTLFLGFGILIGASLFGFLDSNATAAITCEMPWYWDTTIERWRATYAQFVWVPLFALAISIMHQAKMKHLPAMVLIATCGHQAFYWSLSRFAQNLQFSGLIAAFTGGLLANVYALTFKCLASPVLMPAVLVIIPNALAASGGLVAGVTTADAIVRNHPYHLQDGLITRDVYPRDFNAGGPSGSTGLIITSVFGMAQATIGITVGLFLSAFVMWPLTRRSTRFLGL